MSALAQKLQFEFLAVCGKIKSGFCFVQPAVNCNKDSLDILPGIFVSASVSAIAENFQALDYLICP